MADLRKELQIYNKYALHERVKASGDYSSEWVQYPYGNTTWEWNTAGIESVQIFNNQPYDKLAYDFNTSTIRGNRLNGLELNFELKTSPTTTGDDELIDESEVLGEMPANYLWLKAEIFVDSPTAIAAWNPSNPQPVATATRRFTDWPASSFTILLTGSSGLGFISETDHLYVLLSGYYSSDAIGSNIVESRYSLGYYKLTQVFAQYEVESAETTPPEVSTPIFEIVTPQAVDSTYASELAGIWISGVSKCKVSAAVTSEVTPTSVYFTSTGHSEPVSMTLENGLYVGATEYAVTNGLEFTVTAVAGGKTGTGSAQLLGVKNYSDPSVSITQIYRCDIVDNIGVQNDGGHYYRLRISTNVSELTDENNVNKNAITLLQVGILNNSGTGIYNPHNLDDTSDWQGPFGELGNENNIYVIVVQIKDKVGRATGEELVSLNGVLRDIVMRRDTTNNVTHLGVGMTPDPNKGNGHTTIQLPAGAKIIVGGVDITEWLRNQIGGTW